MPSFRVLVFNPSRNSESDKLISILNEEPTLEYHIANARQKKHPDNWCKPDLIFVFLDCCKQPRQKELLNKFFEQFRMIPTIGVISSSTPCAHCETIQKLTWSFITIPFSKQDILLNIHKFLPNFSGGSPRTDKDNIRVKLGFDLLKGRSKCLMKIKRKISQIAPFNVNVLLCGQTGTGKELTAKLIHFLSPRSKKPFVPLNCGSIPKDLFENELFGHKKGAYTHAEVSEKGLIAAADGGTLFLDEVESLLPSSQVKLLRFLEEKKYKPLGQPDYLPADVRVIAAAKDNLWDMVRDHEFREDLFYRLNVVQIYLPSLRERREDIPPLTEHFVERYSALYNKPVSGVSSAAMLKLLNNEWPGNVRELENVLQEAVVTAQTDWIEPEDIDLNKLENSDDHQPESFKAAKRKAVTSFEKDYLKNVMLISHGNITHAAEFARKDRRAFCRLLKKYDIDPGEFRG